MALVPPILTFIYKSSDISLMNAESLFLDFIAFSPTDSLRTLCRALRYAATNPHQNALRSIYEVGYIHFVTDVLFKLCTRQKNMLIDKVFLLQ